MSFPEWASVVGALLGAVGVVLSAASLGVVLYQVPRARRAAEAARAAAVGIGSVVQLEAALGKVAELQRSIDAGEFGTAMVIARELRLDLARLASRELGGLSAPERQELAAATTDVLSIEQELRNPRATSVTRAAARLGNLGIFLAGLQEQVRSSLE